MAPEEVHSNGTYHCPVSLEWQEFHLEFKEARKSCKELSNVMELILKNTGHLVNLPAVAESISALNILMKEIKDNLIAPATGRDQIPTETVSKMLDAQNKSFQMQSSNNRYMVWVFIFMITALMFILGSLLIGEKYKVIPPLYRPGLPNVEDMFKEPPTTPKVSVTYRSC